MASRFQQIRDKKKADRESKKYQQQQEYDKYISEENTKQEAHLLELSNAAKDAVDNLDYNSTEEDFNNATALNKNWHDQALDYYGDDSKKVTTYGAINETRIAEIKENQKDAEAYTKLETNYDDMWNEIKDLQTTNDDFDFTEVEKVLGDFKTTGKNILEYNKAWVHGQEYKNRLEDISIYIQQGEKLKKEDFDPDTPGFQFDPNEDNLTWMAHMEDAYDHWMNSDWRNVTKSRDLASAAITASIKAKQQLKAQQAADMKEFITEDYTLSLGQDRIDAIDDWVSNAQRVMYDGNPMPDFPDGMQPNEREVAKYLLGQDSNQITYFNQRKKEIQDNNFKNLEERAYSKINKIKTFMGKGLGEDKDIGILRKKVQDPGTYSIGDGKLSGKDTRLTTIETLEENLSEMFKYLESGLQGIIGSGSTNYFDVKDADGNSYIRALINEDYKVGSADYYEMLDAIADAYTKTDVKKARDATQGEFGDQYFFMPDSNEVEKNSYDLLIQTLDVYNALRDIDRFKNEDPTNTGGFNI